MRAAAAHGGEARAFPADVTDREAIEEVVAAATAWLGGLDVLVVSVAGLVYGAFTEIGAEDFDRSLDITFRGVVNSVRPCLGHLERSGGTIVAVGSVASKVPMPLHSAYVAGKFATRGFLSALRVELRSSGSRVRVCMVHPGFVGTPFFDHATSARTTRPHPLRPVYRPEEVAEAIAACVDRPRAEITVGGSAIAATILGVVRPLTDLVLATYGVAGQQRPEAAARPGMLWEPSGDGHVRGTVPGRRSAWNAVRLRARLPRPRR